MASKATPGGAPSPPHAALCAPMCAPMPPSNARTRLEGLKRALRVLQLIYVRQRPTYAHLARPQHLLRAPATRADAALGVHLGAPVPPSEAHARLGGCSAR